MARIETLYFIHHSHTDIGYTHDQPIVFDLHERFITQALTLAERSADSDSDGAFRWTVENTYVLLRWLQHASPREIERFQAMEKAGRIEVTGMFANLTPLLDVGQLAETLQPLRTLRDDYGFTITSPVLVLDDGQRAGHTPPESSTDLMASFVAVLRDVFSTGTKGGTKAEIKSVVVTERAMMGKSSFYRAWNDLVGKGQLVRGEQGVWFFLEADDAE